ncbi:MAG TPA: S8 family serine peptidase, partial [Micromonosporaceae bacterium]
TDARAVGALAQPGGSVAGVVLDELIVHTHDRTELDAFLGRWGGTVLDSFAPDDEGQDHLVRVDVGRADPARLPADLLAAQPHQRGTYRAGDERVLRLLALAAAEWRRGTEVVVDWVTEPVSIESGKAYESADIATGGSPKNVFDWSFMRAGGAMDTGVAAAWQLLQSRGRLKATVRYLVMDGGFNPNFDFPKQSKIRKGTWGEKNPHDCTNGTPCPYHGTDVVLAAMGAVDNAYGTAGPAGPVVSELIAVGNSLDYWSQLRRLEKVAEDEHPDVVNLSFTRDVDAGSAHAKRWTDRRMRHVRDTGALIVAAAGNNGRSVDGDTLWVPCESAYVMCVGGMDRSAKLDGYSNYGEGDSQTSVEIYGPMCVKSIADPIRPALDFTTRDVCGTSVASPFVGGVAALVLAADPTLGPDAVRRVLNETAHVGGLGDLVTGSQRRINALGAVARALDVAVVPPKVTIQAPASGKELGVGDDVELRGTATDFMGRAVKIRWESDRDGSLGEGGATTSVRPLSVGSHVIKASATDSTGRVGSAQVTVRVVDTPPQLAIVSPPGGLKLPAGNQVALVATSLDPDTWTSVADEELTWEVRRDGMLIHQAHGHNATLPAAAVTSGSYVVKASAGGVSVQRSFTATADQPGQPTATITKPAQQLTLSAYNGAKQPVAFAAIAQDGPGVTVSGTRFRWTAYSGSEVKVLCTGSNVPGSGSPGSIVAYRNCAGFTAELGLAQGDLGSTTWTVWLEVFDAGGNVGVDQVNVRIRYVTG